MKRITISTKNPYDIIISSGAIASVGDFLKELYTPRKVCIIADSTAGSLYSKGVMESLEAAGFFPSRILFPSGEHSKNLTTYANIVESLASENLSRSDVVLALGGGVVMDIAGFAAGTYLRGIDLVQVPTTLLSAMDASVGGKNAVNLLQGKNLAGIFWDPRMVICDPETFNNLPESQILDALSEAVKNAIVSDASLVSKIEARDLEYVVERSLSIKKSLVEVDAEDRGLRQRLSFGHTIGHCIEKASSYSVSHGKSVAIGMVAEAKAAYSMGYAKNNTSSEIARILLNLGLPTEVKYTASELLPFVKNDKKFSDGKITIVVPEAVGKCALRKISPAELEEYVYRACE